MEFLAVKKSDKLILVNLFVFGLTAPLASTMQAQTYQSGTDIPTQFKSAKPGSLNIGNPPAGNLVAGDRDRMYFCAPATNPPGIQPLGPTYSVPVA
jgi:hypothetical protein